MKLLIHEKILLWRMTGLLGRNANWFFGLSFRADKEES